MYRSDENRLLWSYIYMQPGLAYFKCCMRVTPAIVTAMLPPWRVLMCRRGMSPPRRSSFVGIPSLLSLYANLNSVRCILVKRSPTYVFSTHVLAPLPKRLSVTKPRAHCSGSCRFPPTCLVALPPMAAYICLWSFTFTISVPHSGMAK